MGRARWRVEQVGGQWWAGPRWNGQRILGKEKLGESAWMGSRRRLGEKRSGWFRLPGRTLGQVTRRESEWIVGVGSEVSGIGGDKRWSGQPGSMEGAPGGGQVVGRWWPGWSWREAQVQVSVRCEVQRRGRGQTSRAEG